MAADGSLIFDTQIDLSGMQKGVDKLGQTVEKSFSDFSSVFLGTLAKDVVTKAFDMITESVDKAMNRLDTMDQFNRVMTTMTGSVETANTALEKTNNIVTGTAYGLDTAAKGVQAFVSSGMDVSKATDTMAAWADATSFYTKGTNAELETVSTALQKMQTKGTVTMEHLQMLLEAGIPAVQIYASAVGKSTEEVTDMMGKGELKTDEFIAVMNEAFETGTSGFPSIAGAAKEAGASWSGSMDNMKAAITRGTAALLEQLDAAFNVKSGMVSFGKAIEGVMKGLAENLRTVIPIAAGAVAALVAFKVISSLPAIIASVKTAIAGLIKTLSGMAATNPVLLMIAVITAAVVALIGVIDGLSNSMDGYQKQMADTRAEEEAQIEANKALLDSLKEVDAEYDKAIATAEETAAVHMGLIDRLTELSSGMQNGTVAAEDQAAAQQEITQITGQLNTEIAGLGLEFDTATGEINKNADALKDAAKQQEEYNKAVAGLKHANDLHEKELDLRVNLSLTNKKLERSETDLLALKNGSTAALNKGIVATWDWCKAAKNACDNAEELQTQQEELNLEIEDYVEIAAQEKQENLTRLQAMNALGETVNDVADKYGLSSEVIKNCMEMNGITLDDWEEKYKASMTEEGLTIDDLAKKWGVSTKTIQAEMDAQGLSLQAWSDNADSKMQEYEDAVSGHTDAIINDFESIPDSYGKSAEELKTILEDNIVKYGEWQNNLKTLSKTMSAEAISYLTSLGPAANSILEEIIAGGVPYQIEWSGMFSDANAMAVEAINTSAPAVTQAAQGVGSEAAGAFDATVSGSDMSGVSDSLAGAISGSTYAVAGAVSSVSNSVQTGFRTMQTNVLGIVTQMMLRAATQITANASTVYMAATNLVTGIEGKLKPVIEKAGTVTKDMMSKISSEIQTGAITVSGKIEAMTAGVFAKLSTLPTNAVSVITNMFRGMVSAMDSMAPSLYARADSIAGEIIDRLNKAFEIRSPSRVTKEIFTLLMKGGIVGMDNEKNSVLSKIDEISGGVLSKLRKMPEGAAQAMQGAIVSNQSRMAASRIYGGEPSVQVLERTKTNTIAPNVVVNNNVDADIVSRRITRAVVRGLA